MKTIKIDGPSNILKNDNLEVIAEGFTYTEGPAWDVHNNRLVFHEIPNDIRYEWSEENGLTELKKGTNKGNGMTFDDDGNLYVCESSSSRLIQIDPNGNEKIMANSFDGWELNSPNDVIISSKNDLIFTDPGYGRIPIYGIEREQFLEYQGVYLMNRDDFMLQLVTDKIIQPNGLCLSPDEKILYVNDTETGTIYKIENYKEDANVSVFVENAGEPLTFEQAYKNELVSGYVDGMKSDAKGNIYVTSVGGIRVYNKDGQEIGTISLPEDVGNFCWGSPDSDYMYVCCRSFVGRIEIKK